MTTAFFTPVPDSPAEDLFEEQLTLLVERTPRVRIAAPARARLDADQAPRPRCAARQEIVMDLEFDPAAVARIEAVVTDANQNVYDIARGIQRRFGEGADPLSHPEVPEALRQGFARNFAAVQMGQAILLCLEAGVPVRDVLVLLDLEGLMAKEKSFDDELDALLGGGPDGGGPDDGTPGAGPTR